MARNSYFILSKDLAATKGISATAKLLLTVLRDYHNKTTGQCNPFETTLADALGVTRFTVIRQLAALHSAGLISIKRTQKGNRYEFPMLQNATSHVAKCDSAELQNATWEASGPLYEPSLLKESARAPKRAAVLPKKKPLQSEVVLERYYALFGGGQR